MINKFTKTFSLRIFVIIITITVFTTFIWIFMNNVGRKSKAALEPVRISFENTTATLNPSLETVVRIVFQTTKSISGVTFAINYTGALIVPQLPSDDNFRVTCSPDRTVDLKLINSKIDQLPQVVGSASSPTDMSNVVKATVVALGASQTLPTGLCWGEITFKAAAPDLDINTGLQGKIEFNENPENWEIVGPESGLIQEFDADKKVVTVNLSEPIISITPNVTSSPSDTPTPPVSTPTIQITQITTDTPTPISTIVIGEPTNTPTRTFTPTPTVGQSLTTKIKLRLRFQGITAKPKKDTMRVLITLNDASLKRSPFSEMITLKSNNEGIFESEELIETVSEDLESLLPIFIKGEKHLQKKICQDKPKENAPGTYRCFVGFIPVVKGQLNIYDFSGIAQVAGDLRLENGTQEVKQDGVINSLDLAYVRNNLGSTDDKVLEIADLNNDGVVNTQDFSLIISALSTRTDEL